MATAPDTIVEEPADAAKAPADPVKAPDLKVVPEDEKPEQAEGAGKKGKKAKKGAKEPAATAEAGAPSVAAHPRAARAVGRAKGWGGLGGFLLGGYLSLPTATPVDAGLRALLAGIVCYVVAWAGAVFAWRRLVMLEIKGREQQLLMAAQAARAQREPAGAGFSAGDRAKARAAS